MFLEMAEWLVWRVVRKQWNLITSEDKRVVRSLVHACIFSIPEDVRETHQYNLNEAEILDKRLARRYDPSLALTEAVNRAVAKKLDKKGHEIEIRPGEKVVVSTELTDGQKAALEFQKKNATRRVRDAK